MFAVTSAGAVMLDAWKIALILVGSLAQESLQRCSRNLSHLASLNSFTD
jgi:hypothetical protein